MTPKIESLYLDNHLFVVVKPAGMLTQADRTGDLDLLSLAKTRIKTQFGKPGRVYLGLVHRIDRPASGVIVLARTSKAAARLTDAFRKREVEKGYLAIVAGDPGAGGVYEDRIVKQDGKPRIDAQHAAAKPAKLSWRRLAVKGAFSLVDIDLSTGRPHQIRLQFASRGYPLKGDMRYGSDAPFDGVNLALHAYSLALVHPTRLDRLTWMARPPETWTGDFDDAIARLAWP